MGIFALLLVLFFGGASVFTATPSLGAVVEIDPKLPFDTADVAMLLPLPNLKDAGKGIRLPISATGPQGPLLSEQNFKSLPLFGSVLDDLATEYKNTFITGVRVDACAPKVDPEANPASCPIQLIRLVAQVLETRNGVTRAKDIGLHLVYLTKIDAPFVAALQELKKEATAMGIETTGAGLGIHPVLRGDYASNPKAVAWGNKLISLLLTRVGEKAQFASSVMVTHVKDGKISWEWSKVPFDMANHKVLAPGDKGYEEAKAASFINNVEGKPDTHLFTAFTGKRGGSVSARSLPVPKLEELLVEAPLSWKDKPEGYEAAYRIENPRELIIPQADCVSCHVATSYRLFAEAKWGAFDAKAKMPIPAGLTGVIEPSIQDAMAKSPYIVLNFAYLFTQPTVSQRTVNEAVEVARFLNKNFIK